MFAVDTNILVYAESVGDTVRTERASALLHRLGTANIVIPAQVLGELFRVLRVKARLRIEVIRERIGDYTSGVRIAPTQASTIDDAVELSSVHRLQIFDAIILTAAAEACCKLLLSEDMGEGLVWRGTTVANPFAATPHPLLADALRA